MELVVAGAQPWFIIQGELYEPEPLVVVEQLPVLLQRVLGRHHKPHLIESGLAEQCLGQPDVPVVDGIEGTAEESDVHGVGVMGGG